jgi:plastocyanin
MGIVVFLMAVGLVAAACSNSSTPSSGATSNPTESNSSGGESEGGQITIGSDAANDHGSKDVSGQEEVEVELDSFYFEPTVVKGTPGAQLKLELSNESQSLHNFTLSDQNIDQDVQPGQSADVTVTVPQSGFVEFFCKYHKGSGMVGELTA